MAINEEGGFFSLPGAQDKIPVIKNGKGLFMSKGLHPTTHIIKSPNRYHPEALNSVYNEHFCMSLARAIGLSVPLTQVVEDEIPFYIIERYDRKVDGKRVLRLHQQDFCQAQGVLSSVKYEIQGGPSIKDNYELILRHSSNVISDVRSFLVWVFFNLLIGNNDSHSKNITFLMHGSEASFSPLYDLLSTAIYPDIRKKFAFKVAGQNIWSEIKSRHLRIMEKDLNLKNHFLSGILDELIDNMESSLPKVMEDMQDFSEKAVFITLQKEIEKRLKHFKRLK
ncbi:MAG: HipA domain-containing protein [Bdellovibrio sp.]